ncbi:unnamed protein product [Oikopleura dioica]|uniref:Uncharacterized protein n=1 Tax=Oikopleura dioica TaxID=34765 RepID=E4XR65_OIKDI|nr:unnamed protein product [Oikopleura dioica]
MDELPFGYDFDINTFPSNNGIKSGQRSTDDRSLVTQICGQEDSFSAKWRPVASRISGLDEIFGLDEPEPIPINPSPTQPSPLQQPSSSGLQNSTPSSIQGNELGLELTPQHSSSGKQDISPHTSEALSTHDPCTPQAAMPALNPMNEWIKDVKSEVVDDDLFGTNSMSQKVLKKEIITEIAKRTKTKNSESNTTIMMSPAELERKTIKPTNSLQAMIMRDEEQAPVQSNNSLTEKGFVQLRLEDIKKSPGYMDDSIASSSAHQPLLQHDASEVIGIDEDNDDQPLDNLDFDANPGSSGTFQSPTPLEIPAELTQKIHETESIKNEFMNAQQEENKSKKSVPVLVPPPVVGLDRKSDLPQMPKLVPCPSPRRPQSAGSSRNSPSRKRKSSPAHTELPVNTPIIQPTVLQPPKLTAITPPKTTMSSSDNEQPQKEPPIIDVGARCFVKYDQYYYPAVVHEILGPQTNKCKVSFCDQQMTKAISVDKSDILLISDLEVGMKTVARNIISKDEWVPCTITGKIGRYRNVDLRQEKNRRFYSTRCGYRVMFEDSSNREVHSFVSVKSNFFFNSSTDFSVFRLRTGAFRHSCSFNTRFQRFIAFFLIFKIYSRNSVAAQTTNTLPNASNLMLDNVIITPRRKRKERVTLNSTNPVKRNRQALDTAYILDDGRGIQIPEEALRKVGTDTAEINELVNARRVLYKFVTTTKSLKMPSRSLFIALLNNVQIVRWSSRTSNFEPLLTDKNRNRLFEGYRFEFTEPIPNNELLTEFINLAGGALYIPELEDDNIIDIEKEHVANVFTVEGRKTGQVTLSALLEGIFKGSRPSFSP